MTKFSAGTIAWCSPDPTGGHDDRPVIVLSHETRPFSSMNCTVMGLGTSASSYDHSTPKLEDHHYSGISLAEDTYLMPWSLHSIPPGCIQSGRATGSLTSDGKELVKRELVRLMMG